MFGYVRPMRGELKVKEFDAYRAAYCGLCHTLGQRYGFVARMTLNYDFTFLAMLLAQREGRDGSFCQRRCPVHPTQKKTMCVAGEGMEIAADESVILTYWKLRDNVSDRGFWKGLPHRCAARLLRGAYRKAAALRPEFDSTVTACLKELGGLEEAGSPSLDRTADTFARILSAAAPAGPDETANRALKQILYHVGRWIYIVDGVDDLAEDEAARAYNPVAARFAGHPDNEYLRKTLQNSRSLACAALELVDFGSWSEILRNILYLGLPMVEDLVFTGRWREAQKTIGRTTNE